MFYEQKKSNKRFWNNFGMLKCEKKRKSSLNIQCMYFREYVMSQNGM